MISDLGKYRRRDESFGRILQWSWDAAVRLGTINSGGRRAARFGRFGQGSAIVFPWTSLYGERWIAIGADTLIGPNVVLSAGGIPEGQQPERFPVVDIGDRVLIGRGSGIVGHLQIEIGDDVWTGHHVFVTDQNHGYEDLSLPIWRQSQPDRPVRIGARSWLGHGTVVLPGVTIGEHVVVAANSVVSRDLPGRCVAAGNPARVIRRYDDATGWVRTD